MDDFYLTVISGCNQIQFENTPSDFTNRLPKPLDLPGNMTFGISEISYVPVCNNFLELKYGFSVFDFLHEIKPWVEGSPVLWGETFTYAFEGGYMKSEKAICSYLNEFIWNSIPRLKKKKIFYYDGIKRKFCISAKGKYITLFLSPELTNFLGFTQDVLPFIDVNGLKVRRAIVAGKSQLSDTNTFKHDGITKTLKPRIPGTWLKDIDDGPSAYDTAFRTRDTLLIYSDLVQEQISGDTYTNLIRMCSIPDGVDNRRVVEKFPKIQYMSVNKRHVPTISINIKDAEDRFISLRGLTYIKLHFRERK